MTRVIAYAASQRWADSIEPQIVIRATAKLAALYGGEVSTSFEAQVSHSAALTDIFLGYRQNDPDFTWELVYSKPGTGALPDAISGDVAIEVIGRYSGSQVAAKLALAEVYKLVSNAANHRLRDI